jgi:hypothetical protein
VGDAFPVACVQYLTDDSPVLAMTRAKEREMAKHAEILWGEEGEFTCPGNRTMGMGEGWFWRACAGSEVGPFATMIEALEDSLREPRSDAEQG